MFILFAECHGSWSSDKYYTDLKLEKPCYKYAHFTRSNTTSPVIASFTGTLRNNRKIYIFRQTSNQATFQIFYNNYVFEYLLPLILTSPLIITANLLVLLNEGAKASLRESKFYNGYFCSVFHEKIV